MFKRRIFAAFLTAGTLSLPSPVYAHHGEPVYHIIFYSDATYLHPVGYDYGDCLYIGPTYTSRTGQWTDYVEYRLIGYCAQGSNGYYNWEAI